VDESGDARGNQSDQNWYHFVMTGSFKGGGYLSSIIDG